MNRLLILILVYIAAVYAIHFNRREIDSLLSVINSSTADTSLARSLIDLGYLYEHQDPDSAEIMYQKALQLSEKLSSQTFIALSKNKIGNTYLYKGDYGNAIEHYLAALRIYEELGDKTGKSKAYNNISIVYLYQKNYPSAIDYLERSLKLAEELNDKTLMRSKFINFGYVYNELKDYEKSQQYYMKALKLFEEAGDRRGVSTCYINMGVNHKSRGEYEKALDYYLKALKTKEELNEKKGLSIINVNIAEVYSAMNKNNEAVAYALRGLDIAKHIGALELQKDAYKMLFAAYDSLGNYRSAYEYHKLYTQVNDSIYNIENSKEINELLTKYDSDKKEKENELLAKDNEIKHLALEKEATLRNYLIALTAVVILIVLVVSSRLYLKRKANRLLMMKNDLITKQKKELAENVKKLHELNATKDKLFSIIGHDLRTPFQAIIGFSELLKNDSSQVYTDKMRSKVEHINMAGKNTSALLSNLLEWSRSQTGSIDYKPEKLLLKNSIENEAEILNINAKKKNIIIDISIPEDIVIFADRNMVSTVLRNLISNAIKFTHENGNISVTAIKENGFIKISVADNGIGISPDIIGKIFDIDFQSSAKGTNNETGTGLGLVLCREFVERNGGKIGVESVLGKGSVFSFTLPSANELLTAYSHTSHDFSRESDFSQ
jgi:signal transduction histidine kinase/Tfp pilus assembly protein PilF